MLDADAFMEVVLLAVGKQVGSICTGEKAGRGTRGLTGGQQEVSGPAEESEGEWDEMGEYFLDRSFSDL